jgi:hypothetical protein
MRRRIAAWHPLQLAVACGLLLAQRRRDLPFAAGAAVPILMAAALAWTWAGARRRD